MYLWFVFIVSNKTPIAWWEEQGSNAIWFKALNNCWTVPIWETLIMMILEVTGLSQHTVQGNFELYSISLNFIYKIMVQMSFYCVYILPQSYARVQFPKFLRFLWEIKAASAKKVRKTGQPFSQQPVHQHFLVLKEHQNVWNFLGW